MKPVAALFCRADSVYRTLPAVDVWDIERDARKWPGGCPVVAHPPCRAWGRLRALANPRHDEKALALWAVKQVQDFGGVLEHPAFSTLWAAAKLPRPGEGFDQYGGWTLDVYQHDWGHKAEKRTWLYMCGIHPAALPDLPLQLGEATHVVCTSGRRKDGSRLRKGDPGKRPELSKADRERTPPRIRAMAGKPGREDGKMMFMPEHAGARRLHARLPVPAGLREGGLALCEFGFGWVVMLRVYAGHLRVRIYVPGLGVGNLPAEDVIPL